MYVSNVQALVDKKISFTLMIAVFPHNNFIVWLGYAFYYTVKRRERQRERERENLCLHSRNVEPIWDLTWIL